MSNWNLYENNTELKPLKFSNNKTQEDVVNEVLEQIKKGHKVIFIKGVCGTGKSAIALNLAKEIGKSSIVVPIKNLQEQYKDDYTNKKYLLKKNKEKLKISVIIGRQNFPCQFLKENKEIQESSENQEKNSTLDIFDYPEIKKREKNKEKTNSCDNPFIPCKIEIKDRNSHTIRTYLQKNKKIKNPHFLQLSNVKRMSIAPICPYWSPIIPSEIKLSVLDDAICKDYQGLKNTNYTIYQRKKGCGYYDQYQSYINSDVLIFNSHKYKLETIMNRKPLTEIEIIDECDEFLDSFSNHKNINLNRLNFALSSLFGDDEKIQSSIKSLIKLTSGLIKDNEILNHIIHQDILKLKDTEVYSILKTFLETNLMHYVECDEENYCYQIEETAKDFEFLFKDSYITFEKQEKDIIAKIVTTNLEKRFQELLNKNKILVLMSGTIHSEQVLKDIFGISDFKVIDAETEMPGKISNLRTGLEVNCRYANFKSNQVTREQYLLSLQKSIQQANLPTLVHVISFSDLPSEYEKKRFNLSILTREELVKQQKNSEEFVKKFKSGEIKTLYSTRCNRGVDFPGKICNSIVLTKFPFPNVSSLFWKILKRTMPQHYSKFYMDKARREFLQRIYRGLRSESDCIYLLSPDIRVFEMI